MQVAAIGLIEAAPDDGVAAVVGARVAVVTGVAANGEVRLHDNDIVRPLLISDGDTYDESWKARVFPSFFAGVRLF